MSPAGAAITDTVLLADEGRRTIELPPGTAVMSSGTGFGRQAGSPVVLRPTRQSTDLVFDIDPGSGGTAIFARYTSEYADLVVVDAVESTAEQVSGVIRNESDVDLEHVVAIVGAHAADVGMLEAGTERVFTVDLTGPGRLLAPELRDWGVEGWFGFDGFDPDDPEVSDGPINASSWLEWRAARLGTAAPQGVVTAVGWSRDLDASLLGGDGRTAIVARAPISRVDGPLQPDLVRSFPGRLPPAGVFNDGPVAFDGEFQPGRVHRFVLPPGTESPDLAVEVNVSVADVQVWRGGEWLSFDLPRDGARLSVAVPTDYWVDDVLWLRSIPSNAFDPTAQLVELTERDATTLELGLLGPGERPERAEFVDGQPPIDAPFPAAAPGLVSDVVLDETGAFSAFGDLFGSYDVWLIELVEGQEVSVTMTAVPGGNVDPYLIVRGPNGDVVAENDDFRGLDSQVDFTAGESGVYEIETRPLGEFDQFGGYEVSILTDPPGAQ